MEKWKIIQIILKLPKEKQLPAILLLFIFISLGSNTIIALYFRSEIADLKKENQADKKYYQKLIKSKDSVYVASQNKHLDFVEQQLKEGFGYERKIDSLEQSKNRKK